MCRRLSTQRVIRAELLDLDVLAESAQRNFDVYGFYGASVFAETDDLHWAELAAERFPAVPWLVLFAAGDLQAAGPEPWDTGLGAPLRRGPRRSGRAGGSYAGDRTPGGAEPAPRRRR